MVRLGGVLHSPSAVVCSAFKSDLIENTVSRFIIIIVF